MCRMQTTHQHKTELSGSMDTAVICYTSIKSCSREKTFESYLMMRANIKQQRWDHTNSLLATDVSLERKNKHQNQTPSNCTKECISFALIFSPSLHKNIVVEESLHSKIRKQSKPQNYKPRMKFG